MRRNMRFDGIPFAPVTVRRAEDKPRLVILADVSLSVRATARFTLHLVHGLQSLFGQVRTFAFVADLVEITDLFADHPVEQALGLVFGGDVLDVDANSDYGAAFGAVPRGLRLRRQPPLHGDRPRRRPGQRQRPQPRGVRRDHPPRPGDDLAHARAPLLVGAGRLRPAGYAEYCSRVRVVRDLTGLESAAEEMADGVRGPLSRSDGRRTCRQGPTPLTVPPHRHHADLIVRSAAMTIRSGHEEYRS